MLTLTLIVVGFLVTTGLVVALARGRTARWEQSRRSSAAVRPAVRARRTSPARSAVRRAAAATRRGVAVLRTWFPGFPQATVLARRVRKDLEPGAPRGRPIRRLVDALRSWPPGGPREGRRTKGRSPAPPVDGDEADTALAPETSPETPPATTDIRRSAGAGGTRRDRFRRTAAAAPRRVLALLHRHDDRPHERHPHGSGDGRPTARP